MLYSNAVKLVIGSYLLLQFEWAWQHPTESVAMRQAAVTFKSFSGVANKIKLAHTMLNLPNWQRYNYIYFLCKLLDIILYLLD